MAAYQEMHCAIKKVLDAKKLGLNIEPIWKKMNLGTKSVSVIAIMLEIMTQNAVFLVESCMFVEYIYAGYVKLQIALHYQVFKLNGYQHQKTSKRLKFLELIEGI